MRVCERQSERESERAGQRELCQIGCHDVKLYSSLYKRLTASLESSVPFSEEPHYANTVANTIQQP